MRQYIENSGGRRFLMAIGAGAMATFLQWFGKLDPQGSSYSLIVLGTVAAYITGNSYQKVKGGSSE